MNQKEFELELSDYERDALSAYAEKCLANDKEEIAGYVERWYGIMPEQSERMFDINIFDNAGHVAIAHLCEATDDENWTITDKCTLLWSKQDELSI